jgi:hypothetical protein
LVISGSIIGQSKVLISNEPSVVPKGKKWIISVENDLNIKTDTSCFPALDSCILKLKTRFGTLGFVVKGKYLQPDGVLNEGDSKSNHCIREPDG